MSFLNDLFIHVSDRIETLQDNQGNPIVRWIDFDLGQLDGDKPAVSFPCALLSFGDAYDFLTLGDNSQQAMMTVTLKYAFNIFERTSSKTTAIYRAQATSHLDILERCHAKIQGTDGMSFGHLERASVRSERRADLRVYEVDYLVAIYPASPSEIEGNTEGYNNYIKWQDLPTHPATPVLDVVTDML
jgi:hypothetical protein